MEVYTVKQITEADYGCEETDEKGTKALLILETGNNAEKRIEVAEKTITAAGISEGKKVCFSQNGEVLKYIRVVAAVIRNDDRIFATARGYGEYKGWWEFPGGKIEAGESPQQALAREIREELTAEIKVGGLIKTIEYDYPEFHLSMDCFWCEVKEGKLKLLEHEAARWLSADDLWSVNWLPADALILKQIEELLRGHESPDDTLTYYEKKFENFISETIDADTEPLRKRFLSNIPDGGTILDLGCGSGRDTRAFLNAGYRVSAIDGSAEICHAASKYTGIDVKCMDFFDLSNKEEYDGIWACASVLHVEKKKIPGLLRILYKALNQGGVLYLSFKYGDHNGFRDGRHFTDLDERSFRELLEQAYSDGPDQEDFRIIDEWQSEDVRRGKIVQWLNVILRKSV